MKPLMQPLELTNYKCHHMTQLALHFGVGFVSLGNENVHAWLPAGIRG